MTVKTKCPILYTKQAWEGKQGLLKGNGCENKVPCNEISRLSEDKASPHAPHTAYYMKYAHSESGRSLLKIKRNKRLVNRMVRSSTDLLDVVRQCCASCTPHLSLPCAWCTDFIGCFETVLCFMHLTAFSTMCMMHWFNWTFWDSAVLFAPHIFQYHVHDALI